MPPPFPRHTLFFRLFSRAQIFFYISSLTPVEDWGCMHIIFQTTIMQILSLSRSRSEQAPGSEFHPRDEREKK